MNMISMRRLRGHPGLVWGAAVIALFALAALFAPLLGTLPPDAIDPSNTNLSAGATGMLTPADGEPVPHTFWMGTDSFGRDVYSRVLYGARTSLLIAVCTAALATVIGAVLGLLAGFVHWVDVIEMRVMDGVMAIPSILLAIALVAALGAKLSTLVIAIAVPEIPRVARLVRSVVLGLRDEAFVEAARALATPTITIVTRHVFPNTVAPLIVQATFIAASAVLTEAVLSFLGLGLPPDIPTWGGIMAEGRTQFSQHPGTVLFPVLAMVPMMLAINIVGDGLRDLLDPTFKRPLA